MHQPRPTAALLLALAGAALTPAARAQTTSRYVGPNNGFWSEPTNWNPVGVPANDGQNAFNVIVPANVTVNFDLPVPTTVTGTSFEPGSRVNLADTSLDVLGVSLLESAFLQVNGSAASFTTHAPFATGSNQRGEALGGAICNSHFLPTTGHRDMMVRSRLCRPVARILPLICRRFL